VSFKGDVKIIIDVRAILTKNKARSGNYLVSSKQILDYIKAIDNEKELDKYLKKAYQGALKFLDTVPDYYKEHFKI